MGAVVNKRGAAAAPASPGASTSPSSHRVRSADDAAHCGNWSEAGGPAFAVGVPAFGDAKVRGRAEEDRHCRCGRRPMGDASLPFSPDQQDLLEVLISYFRAGLDNDEFCLWVVTDPLNVEEARDAVCRAIPGAKQKLAAGDMEIEPHYNWYLEHGAFDFERVTHLWTEKLESALSRGYQGMRANGMVAWLSRTEWPLFSAYEEGLNEVISGLKLIVLCTYPLTKTTAAELLDVARTHQLAIAKRHGNWEILETPALKNAKLEIARLNERLEARLNGRTHLRPRTEHFKHRSLNTNGWSKNCGNRKRSCRLSSTTFP